MRVCPCLTPLYMVVQRVFCPLAEHQKRLATFSIVLGSLYMGAAVIFLFGVGAAVSVRHQFLAHSPL